MLQIWEAESQWKKGRRKGPGQGRKPASLSMASKAKQPALAVDEGTQAVGTHCDFSCSREWEGCGDYQAGAEEDRRQSAEKEMW